MIKIIKAEDRLKEGFTTNVAIFGPAGVGKTTQARTLDPEKTLFIDLEAGMLAVQDWKGDCIDVKQMASEMGAHPWEIARALASVITGPDYSSPNGPYSKPMYDSYIQHVITPEALSKYDTIFVDSITVAARFAFSWSKLQPEAFSEKTGKPDNRGAYGLLGQEMVTWLTMLQHAKKSIIVVGILDQDKDEFNRVSWVPQIEGSKTGRELPGIFDEVLTLQNITVEGIPPYRAFVCTNTNPWGYPAKDRSGCLEMQEPPDLGALLKKIKAGKRLDTTLKTNLPDTQTTK